MKLHLLYHWVYSLVTLVVTFTRSDAGEIGDGFVRAMWKSFIRTAGEEIM